MPEPNVGSPRYLNILLKNKCIHEKKNNLEEFRENRFDATAMVHWVQVGIDNLIVR